MDMAFMGLQNKKIQANISKVKITKYVNTHSGSLKTQILWERHCIIWPVVPNVSKNNGSFIVLVNPEE
jgi:hypothetical protein